MHPPLHPSEIYSIYRGRVHTRALTICPVEASACAEVVGLCRALLEQRLLKRRAISGSQQNSCPVMEAHRLTEVPAL